VLETTALGAAYLAGLTTDMWKSREEISAHWEMERIFEPQMNADAAAELLARWRDAVHRSLRWAELA
jgi:glycerol kinase